MNDQRLIDANALKEHKYYDETRLEYCVPVYNIDTAPTIEPKRGEWITKTRHEHCDGGSIKTPLPIDDNDPFGNNDGDFEPLDDEQMPF